MDERACRFLANVLLALALLLAIETVDFRDPDPEVPRYVIEVPSEHELGPKGCAPFC